MSVDSSTTPWTSSQKDKEKDSLSPITNWLTFSGCVRTSSSADQHMKVRTTLLRNRQAQELRLRHCLPGHRHHRPFGPIRLHRTHPLRQHMLIHYSKKAVAPSALASTKDKPSMKLGMTKGMSAGFWRSQNRKTFQGYDPSGPVLPGHAGWRTRSLWSCHPRDDSLWLHGTTSPRMWQRRQLGGHPGHWLQCHMSWK